MNVLCKELTLKFSNILKSAMKTTPLQTNNNKKCEWLECLNVINSWDECLNFLLSVSLFFPSILMNKWNWIKSCPVVHCNLFFFYGNLMRSLSCFMQFFFLLLHFKSLYIFLVKKLFVFFYILVLFFFGHHHRSFSRANLSKIC